MKARASNRAKVEPLWRVKHTVDIDELESRANTKDKQIRRRTRSIGPSFFHLTFWKYESDRSKKPHWAPGDRRFLVVGFGRGVVGYFMLRSRP